jgi:formate C-acetyltransferase
MAYLDLEKNLQNVREMYLKKLLKPELTSERAKLITESYQQTESEPMILRRAKALHTILSKMTIYLQPWELLAGNLGPAPVSAPIYPEGGVDFILDELDIYETRPGDKFAVSKTVKQELRKILPWWQGKTLKEHGVSLLPPEVITQREAGVFGAENMLTCGTGHFLPDYRKIIRWGFTAIEQSAREHIERLELLSSESFEQKLFYEACLIICEAIRTFATRYVRLAEEMAASESDAERKQELALLANICRKVPMQPATTFLEALQAIWFTHLICYIDSNGYGVTLGRIARDLSPFYRKSLGKGELTKDQARTYLMSFLLKCNDILKLYNNMAAHVGFGKRVGATPDGRFAHTPLSDANSPSQGAVKNGVTAVLRSEAKLPHHKAINGTLLNVKLTSSLLSQSTGLNNLASLIKAHFKLGGFHVQFNVVDVETLRDAQQHPEKYPDFLIRVAAYVTNWHQLSKDVQDEIIARSELETF